jgi:predicted nucleotidyltransferase
LRPDFARFGRSFRPRIVIAYLSQCPAARAAEARFPDEPVLLFHDAVTSAVARDEAGPESDVDLLVEFDRSVGMFALTRLRDQLEHWLGRRVDLLTTDALKAPRRERVMREALRAA